MPNNHRDSPECPPSPDSSVKKDARITVNIDLFLWEERLVAAYSGDPRLEATLEFGSDFYERISGICFRKPVQALTEEEKQLGSVLARAGGLGLGKRYVSRYSILSPVAAQKLLNQYYAVFSKVKDWLKNWKSEIVQSRINLVRDESLARCVKNLPLDWLHVSALTFSLPSYIYEVQAEKFFKHHFEREIEVKDRILKLPVEVRFCRVPEAHYPES